jgi:hypothetical protein
MGFSNANTVRVCVYVEFLSRYVTVATTLSSSPYVTRPLSQHVQEIMTYASRYLDHG